MQVTEVKKWRTQFEVHEFSKSLSMLDTILYSNISELPNFEVLVTQNGQSVVDMFNTGMAQLAIIAK